MNDLAEPQKSIDTLQESAITFADQSLISKIESPQKSLIEESRAIHIEDHGEDHLDKEAKRNKYEKLDQIIKNNNRHVGPQRGLSTIPVEAGPNSFKVMKLESQKGTIPNIRKGGDAGMSSREYNTVERHSTSLQKELKRTYGGVDETQRKIEQGDI